MEILQLEMYWVIFHDFSFHKTGGSPYKNGPYLNPVKSAEKNEVGLICVPKKGSK